MRSATNVTFERKEAAILKALAVPEDDYSDRSPKGSVDAGIRELVDEINRCDGLVTTSSCAGRISVFAEGRKQKTSSLSFQEEPQQERRKDETTTQDAADDGSNASTVPSGKGMGGRWLFVSHEPVSIPLSHRGQETGQDADQSMHKDKSDGSSLTALLGLPAHEPDSGAEVWTSETDPAHVRLVKFQFEPAILHVMTASLEHAQRVLAAALDAGFRESGVQSLRALQSTQACPMVAIRTAGLGLSAVVGLVDDDRQDIKTGEHHVEQITTLVSNAYLSLLVSVANTRFQENTQRLDRLRAKLVKCSMHSDIRQKISNLRGPIPKRAGSESSQNVKGFQACQ